MLMLENYLRLLSVRRGGNAHDGNAVRYNAINSSLSDDLYFLIFMMTTKMHKSLFIPPAEAEPLRRRYTRMENASWLASVA